MSIIIGPVHIADADGTHEPGATIDTPSDALIALADAKTLHPESGLPYAAHAKSAPANKPAPTSAPDAPEATN